MKTKRKCIGNLGNTKLIIFGAQGYALGAYQAIKSIYPEREIPFFLVSSLGNNNAPILGGIPVKEIKTISLELRESEKMNLQILIATPEDIQQEIEEILENYGFHNHARLTSEYWDELMKLYHMKLGLFKPLQALPVGCTKPFIKIFIAKSHADRPLRENIKYPEYVFPIQVGRENADTNIADLVDNSGENISERNGIYSELTGLYWLWRNEFCKDYKETQTNSVFEKLKRDSKSAEKQYYGFGQYRRTLEISSDDLLRLVNNDVDVVLPYPLPYEPNINAHHRRYIKDSDWKALLQVIAENEPEYSKFLSVVMNQQFLYNYNVIIAKKQVICDYCSWLFPILEKIEEVTNGKNRSDRYIGYMAETLETLFFMKNSKRLNIVHALCKLHI